MFLQMGINYLSILKYKKVPIFQENIQETASSEMKSSKSVGDIMVEIKKEAEALERMKIKGHQRKNSRTPPPRPPQPNAAGRTFQNDRVYFLY